MESWFATQSPAYRSHRVRRNKHIVLQCNSAVNLTCDDGTTGTNISGLRMLVRAYDHSWVSYNHHPLGIATCCRPPNYHKTVSPCAPSKRKSTFAMQKNSRAVLNMPSIIHQSMLRAMRVFSISQWACKITTEREANGYRSARAERRVSPVKDCASIVWCIGVRDAMRRSQC